MLHFSFSRFFEGQGLFYETVRHNALGSFICVRVQRRTLNPLLKKAVCETASVQSWMPLIRMPHLTYVHKSALTDHRPPNTRLLCPLIDRRGCHGLRRPERKSTTNEALAAHRVLA